MIGTWLRQNLLHNKVRTLVSVVGVSVPAVPIFLQLGLYAAMMETATLFYDHLDFDLVLHSPDYLYFPKADRIPSERVHQARAIEGVLDSSSFRIGFNMWRNPETGQEREILVMGFDPLANPFTLDEIQKGAGSLSKADTVMIDALTRPEFGPREKGLETELGGQRVEITGQYHLGTGFTSFGALVTGERTFAHLFGRESLNLVSLGLLKTDPRTSPETAADQLRRIFPGDVRVSTREEMLSLERRYWTGAASLGTILTFGLLVTFVVGIIVIYQIVSTDVQNRLSEYATLKAMGYRDQYLATVVIYQSVVLCLLGFLPGFTLSLILYRVIVNETNLPIYMTVGRSALILLLTLLMSLGAGFFCIRKLRSANPADLFG